MSMGWYQKIQNQYIACSLDRKTNRKALEFHDDFFSNQVVFVIKLVKKVKNSDSLSWNRLSNQVSKTPLIQEFVNL